MKRFIKSWLCVFRIMVAIQWPTQVLQIFQEMVFGKSDELSLLFFGNSFPALH